MTSGDRRDRALVAPTDLQRLRECASSLPHPDRGRAVAVETNAGPVERALDEIARSIESPPFDLGDQLVAALACAALWRVVFEGAMREDDSKLARIAAEQIRNAQDAYRGLAALADRIVSIDDAGKALLPP